VLSGCFVSVARGETVNFLVPASAAFLGLLLPLLTLYLLKRRRQDLKISSILLWERVLDDMQAQTPFQKLRRNLLLLLQILLIMLLTAALMQPVIKGRGRKVGRAVVIIDNSASMGAVETEGSRWEMGMKAALKLIRGLREGHKMMVIEARSVPRVVQGFSSDKELLTRKLQALEQVDGASNMTDALLLAAASLGQNKGKVYLITDGAMDALPVISGVKDGLEIIQIGTTSNNIGITAVDVRKVGDDAQRKQVFVRIANASQVQQQVEVILFHNSRILERQFVPVHAEGAEAIFEAEVQTGVIEVVLEVTDALAADNRAWVIMMPLKEIKILVTGSENMFLVRALNSDPQAKVFLSDTDAGEDLTGYDLVIYNQSLTSGVFPQEAFMIDPPENTNLFIKRDRHAVPGVVDWDSGDPFLRFVELTDVHLAKATHIEARGPARTLINGVNGPLLQTILAKDGKRVHVLGFNLLQSDWPLRASFPIFWRNLTGYLQEKQAHGTYRPGSTIEIKAFSEEILIEGPNNESWKLPKQQAVFFNETAHVGVYRITSGEEETLIALNLFDAAQSNIRPRITEHATQHNITLSNSVENVNQEIWPWILAMGLLLTMAEWFCFHRGIT